jgi:hypothetical protein
MLKTAKGKILEERYSKGHYLPNKKGVGGKYFPFGVRRYN